MAEIYTDADDINENPNHFNLQKKALTKDDNLSLKLAPGGGLVIRLKK